MDNNQWLKLELLYEKNHWNLHFFEKGARGEVPVKDKDGNIIKNEKDVNVKACAENWLDRCMPNWKERVSLGEDNV